MPRNRTTNASTVVQLREQIRNIKAEMNPSVRTYRPPAQPSPIKDGVEGRWSYSRYRVTKTAAAAGGTVPITAGDLAAQIGGTSGLPTFDFQIDKLSVWLLGSTDYQRSELAVTPGPGLLGPTVSFTQRDYGTIMRPAAIGMNIPRTLGVISNAVTSATSTRLLDITFDGTGITGSSSGTLVVDFWVLYRVSA